MTKTTLCRCEIWDTKDAKYMEQIKEVKESNRKSGNYPNPMTKELNDSQKLSPVITLVLNYSQNEWESQDV